MVLGWLLLGIQVWLLVTDVAKDGVHSLLIALGAYSLACSLALLLAVVPNGIGAREVILVAALAPVLPHGVALAAKLVATVPDLAWAGSRLPSPGPRGTAVPPRLRRPPVVRRRANMSAGTGRHRRRARRSLLDPRCRPL